MSYKNLAFSHAPRRKSGLFGAAEFRHQGHQKLSGVHGKNWCEDVLKGTAITSASAANEGYSGGFNSRTMIVMITANTPSEKLRRALCLVSAESHSPP